MSTYTAKNGDTFELISRRMFGTATQTGNIRRANPSLSEPLTAGDEVFVPSVAVENKVTPDNPDSVTVLINKKEFRYFNSVEFQSRFASFDSCVIVAPFEPDNLEFRKAFVPFSYASIDVFIGSELIFSGTQMGLTPQVSTESKVVILEAYAKCAVINDSSLPISSYPIELRDLKINAIARELCRPFPFNVKSDVDVGSTFESASISHTDKIYSFLTTLAKQRDVVITNDTNGDLLITKAIDAKSVAHLRDDASPVLAVTPMHDEQNYFSDYTVVVPVIIGGLPIASYTAKNKRLGNILRVENFDARDALNGEERQIAESRRARGLANSISYNVDLATIRDPDGNLYRPNTYVNLIAPTAMIYRDTKFFVRAVSIVMDGDKQTCQLDLVLPESFNGNDVEVFPWEE